MVFEEAKYAKKARDWPVDWIYEAGEREVVLLIIFIVLLPLILCRTFLLFESNSPPTHLHAPPATSLSFNPQCMPQVLLC